MPRFVDFYPIRSDGLCRCGCKSKVLPPRSSWATETCKQKALAVLQEKTIPPREYLEKRDKEICAICGKRDRKWEAHHIVPVTEDGEDASDNMIALCRSCHKIVTAAYAKQKHGKPYFIEFTLPLKESAGKTVILFPKYFRYKYKAPCLFFYTNQQDDYRLFPLRDSNTVPSNVKKTGILLVMKQNGRMEMPSALLGLSRDSQINLRESEIGLAFAGFARTTQELTY